MKKTIAIVLILAALLTLAACGGEQPPAETTAAPTTTAAPETTAAPATTAEPETTVTPETEPVAEEQGLMYQAHRGLSTDFPENTMPAFQGAIDAGFKFIELDPNFTSDGKCILMHDGTINRTCRTADGEKLPNNIAIGSVTYEQLQTYDAGLFKGAQFKGTKVPLLSEVAELVKGTGVQLKIDNKIQNYNDTQLETIFALGEAYPDEMGFTCKTVDFVSRVIKRLPNAIIHYDGPSHEKMFKQVRKLVGEENTLYIWIGVDSATPELCEAAKQYGKLGLWTVKNETQLEKAISLGADLIETNGEVKPPKA